MDDELQRLRMFAQRIMMGVNWRAPRSTHDKATCFVALICGVMGEDWKLRPEYDASIPEHRIDPVPMNTQPRGDERAE